MPSLSRTVTVSKVLGCGIDEIEEGDAKKSDRPLMQVCHNDSDNRNNTLSNLRLNTRKNNCADRTKQGTENLGEKCGTSKLTNEQALEIYQCSWSGQEKLAYIAREFGIRPNTVSAIKNG